MENTLFAKKSLYIYETSIYKMAQTCPHAICNWCWV